MDFEDFSFSDDNFAKDNKLSKIDEARMSVAEKIEDTSKKYIDALKYGEHSNALSLFDTLCSDINILIELESIDVSASDEEIEAAIEKAKISSTKLTLSNMNDTLSSIATEELNEPMSDQSDSDDDSSLDF